MAFPVEGRATDAPNLPMALGILMIALGILFYVASLLSGAAIACYFFDGKIDDIIVKYAIAVPIGFALSAFLVLVMEAINGQFSNALVLFSSLILLLIAALSYLRSTSRRMFRWEALKSQLLNGKVYYVLLFLVVLLLAAMQLEGVQNSPQGLLVQTNFQDFIFHVNIGNSLILAKWPPQLLYVYNTRNTYPFIADFYAAILSENGAGPVNSFYLMDIPLYFSLAVLGTYLIYLLTGRRQAAVFGILLFLFCSVGLNSLLIRLFNMPVLEPYGLVLQQIGGNITGLLELQLFNFSYPMLNNFEPQHDYLMGFPYALIILIALYLLVFTGRRRTAKVQSAYYAFLGFLVGLMPEIHPFSLMFVFAFSVTAFAYSMLGKGRKRRFIYEWLPFGLLAIVVATPQLLFIHSGTIVPDFWGSVITFYVWYRPGISLAAALWQHITIWFVALGPLLPLGLLGTYVLRKRIVAFIPAFAVLILTNLVRLQPSFGDSNKIMLWFVLFMAAAASALLSAIWSRRSVLLKALAAALFIIAVFGSFVFVYLGLFGKPSVMVSNSQIQATTWMRDNMPANSMFVTNCYNNTASPLSALSGRRSVLEFGYYVANAGMSRLDPYMMISTVGEFIDDPNCGFLKDFNISYVVLENASKYSCNQPNYTAFSNSTEFRLTNFSSSDGDIQIYSVNCP